ncbi:hypothetical protein JNK13_06185 [bacterium]|nr:hypothetical protein [bacterium]
MILNNQYLSQIYTNLRLDANQPQHLYIEVGRDLRAKFTTLLKLLEVFKAEKVVIRSTDRSELKYLGLNLAKIGYKLSLALETIQTEISDQEIQLFDKREHQLLLLGNFPAGTSQILDLADVIIHYAVAESADKLLELTPKRNAFSISLIATKDFSGFVNLSRSLPTFLKIPEPLSENLLASTPQNTGRDPFSVLTFEDLSSTSSYADQGSDRRGRGDRPRRDDDRRPRRDGQAERGNGRSARNQEQRPRTQDRRDSEPRSNYRNHERNNQRSNSDTTTRPEQTRSSRGLPRRGHPNDNVRIYIGQGSAAGMTAEVFSNLALEFAEVPDGTFDSIVFRDHYGFADLNRLDAEHLINTMHGIEYNGEELPIEFALTLPRRLNRESYQTNSDQ